MYVFEYSGATDAVKGQVTGNVITNASQAAVEAATDTANLAPTVTFRKNSIALTNAAGFVNQLPTYLDAAQNYWGASDGPSSWSFGAGSSVDPKVLFFPWYTDAPRTTLRACDSTGSNVARNDPSGAGVVICGTAGNDTLRQAGAAPTLFIGKGGNDQMLGGSGDDYMFGNPNAHDFLNGRGGSNDHAECRNELGAVWNVEVTDGC